MMRLKDSRKSLLSHKKSGNRVSLLENEEVRHTFSLKKNNDNQYRSNVVVPMNIEEEEKQEIVVAPQFYQQDISLMSPIV
jgi:hypothetical protein